MQEKLVVGWCCIPASSFLGAAASGGAAVRWFPLLGAAVFLSFALVGGAFPSSSFWMVLLPLQGMLQRCRKAAMELFPKGTVLEGGEGSGGGGVSREGGEGAAFQEPFWCSSGAFPGPLVSPFGDLCQCHYSSPCPLNPEEPHKKIQKWAIATHTIPSAHITPP